MNCQDEVLRIAKKLEKMISSKHVVSRSILLQKPARGRHACNKQTINYAADESCYSWFQLLYEYKRKVALWQSGALREKFTA